MVDTRPFTVGENLAVTPGQVVHRSELFELIQYAPRRRARSRRPLVVIPPQINKYYISDLAPGRSFVEHTVAGGIPYFAVSWRNPTPAQRDWDLATYVSACKEAVEIACDISAADDANVAGMCAGGITLACLLGHLAATGESLVNSATFMVAGLDTRREESTVGLLTSKASIEAARPARSAGACSTAATSAGCSPGCGPTTWSGTTGSTTTCSARTRPRSTSSTGTPTRPTSPPGCTRTSSTCSATNGLAEPGSIEVLGTPIDLGKVRCDAYVVAGADRPHHPVDRGLPDHAAAGRRQRVRARVERAHPGHRQPARQTGGRGS